MSEELTDEFEEDQEGSPPPPQGQSVEDLQREVERLRKKERELLGEVKTHRQQDRENLKRDFPWLTDEDLKGQNPRFLRSLLSKVPPGASQGQEQAAEETPPDPQAQAAQVFAQNGRDLAGGSTAQGEKLTALEAHRKYESGEWSSAEYAAWQRKTYNQSG